MTDTSKLADELRALAQDAFAQAPTPWEVETENSEGEYGSGPNTSIGFAVSVLLDANGRSLFDALNSTACIIHEDGPDEDGSYYAWDDVSASNAKLIVALVNNLPAILAALETDLIEECAKVADENAATWRRSGQFGLADAVKAIAQAIRNLKTRETGE